VGACRAGARLGLARFSASRKMKGKIPASRSASPGASLSARLKLGRGAYHNKAMLPRDACLLFDTRMYRVTHSITIKHSPHRGMHG